MNPYETLGVPKDATPEEIKSAFRKEAKKHHPDSGAQPNAGAFSAASNAHKLLMDPKRREKFDRTGEADTSGIDDPVFNKAMGMIGNAVMQIMQDPNALTRDIPKAIEAMLLEMRGNANKHRDKLIAERTKYEKAIKKLKRKKAAKGQDTLLMVLTSSINQLQHPIDMVTQDRAAVERAIELLDAGSYEFVADRPGFTATGYVNMHDIMAQAMDEQIMDMLSGRKPRK